MRRRDDAKNAQWHSDISFYLCRFFEQRAKQFIQQFSKILLQIVKNCEKSGNFTNLHILCTSYSRLKHTANHSRWVNDVPKYGKKAENTKLKE